ncbi:hypothetical protein V1520DRAFT_387904 [Lipomyces starkeyi]
MLIAATRSPYITRSSIHNSAYAFMAVMRELFLNTVHDLAPKLRSRNFIYNISSANIWKQEALAAKLGLVPQELKKTVDEYNASINDKEFNPMALDGKSTFGLTPNKTKWAVPIKVAPFYGYPLTAKTVFTFGGLKVDLDSRVLSTTGTPIPGKSVRYSHEHVKLADTSRRIQDFTAPVNSAGCIIMRVRLPPNLES